MFGSGGVLLDARFARRNSGSALISAMNRMNGIMVRNSISANALKTEGISAIDRALQERMEAAITVCGEVKYVVVRKERYLYLRECELDAALVESKKNKGAQREKQRKNKGKKQRDTHFVKNKGTLTL